MNTKISFVVPIYNVEKYLEKTILSIVNQSYKNIEIILINDGSTDNSTKICEKYAQKDDRIKYIWQENKGVSAARNRGIDEATGDWICFVDGDDFVETTLCDCARKYLSENIDICFFSYNEFVLGKQKNHLTGSFETTQYGEKDFEKMQLAIFYMQGYTYTNVAAIWGKLFNTAFIKNNNLKFDENQIKSQDTLFMLFALQYAKNGIYFNKNLYNYRIVRESISRRYNPQIFDIYRDLLEQFRSFVFKYKHDSSDFVEAYEYRVFRNFMVATTLDCCHVDNKNEYSIRRKKFLEEFSMDPFFTANHCVKVSKYPMKEKILAIFIKHRNFFAINCLNKLRYIIRKMG